MKITCNSCGSKYTIADAKVQGKKVKVRCKGCKESILVDGTKIGSDGSAGSTADDDNENGDADGAVLSPGADEPMTSATDEEPKKDLWSVNISDEESRDMTLQELIAGWRNGTVTSDAYVWKDGMGDWKPILEVGELKLKLGSPPKKGAVVSSATAGAAGGMDDLFGGVDTAANHPGDVEKLARAPAGAAPTGARNDSSVLFSLDSLNSGGAPAPLASSNTADALFAGLNTGVGSLTGNTDLLTAPAKEPPPAPLGNRAQPVALAPAGKSKTGLVAAILGAAIIIGGAVVLMGGEDEADADAEKGDATAAAEKTEEEKKAEKELAEKTAKLKAMEAELKKAKAEAEKKAASPDEDAKKKEEELKKEKEEAEKKEAEEAAKKDPSGTAAAGTSTKTDSASKPAATSGGAKFDVGAARAALQAAASNAAACKTAGGPTGSGKVQVTFSTSGRVTSATVISGPFGGTAVGGCVASTFRRARVPAFTGDPQTVAKSFTIK